VTGICDAGKGNNFGFLSVAVWDIMVIGLVRLSIELGWLAAGGQH
jgi:hypothetical protein